MTAKHRLKNIKLFEVSKVDFPANQHSEFLLLKRLDRQAETLEADMADQDTIEQLKVAAATIAELKKSVDTLTTENAELKKAAIDPAKAQEAIEKALPAAVRDQLESLRKANESAQLQLAAMADEREIAKAINECAADFPNLPVKADVFGPIMKRAMGVMKAEDMVELRRILKAANAAIADATRVSGYINKTNVAGSAEAEMAAKAAAIAAAEGVTLAKANVLAMERNPDLYTRYTQERGVAN